MRKIKVSVLFSFVFAVLFSNESNRIKFDHISIDDGLSQSVVEVIFQDSRGLMWFGTYDGLNKYDGKSFTVYRKVRGDKNSLQSSRIFSINEDKHGTIWIGTDEGLSWYYPGQNKIVRVPEGQGFPGGKVNDIEIDTDNSIWLGTSNGLVHYLPDEKKFKTYQDFGVAEKSNFRNTVFDIEITTNNKIYFSVDIEGIYEFKRKKETYERHEYKQDYFGTNYKKNITEGFNHLLYIGSEGAKVHVYDPISKESRLLNGINALTVKTNVLPIDENEVWVGTDGGGINVYDPITGQYKYMVSDSRYAGSLKGNAVFDMFKDKDGNIWVGHYGVGISVWRRYKEKFRSYTHNPFNPESINKEVVTAVFEDSKGRLWIGQDGGGLSLLDENTGKFRHFRRQDSVKGSLVTDVIYSIGEAPDGNLLLGTYLGGLMVFDPQKMEVVKTYTTEDGLASNLVWDIFVDSRGRYWLACLGGGVDIFDPQTGEFTNYNDQNSDPKICSNIIMHIAEDKKGNIWLASEPSGISILNTENGTVKNYSSAPENLNSLSSNNVKCFKFQDNYAWIATIGGGLNRLDLKTDSFKVYTTENNFSSNAIMGLLMDGSENLWVSSTRGLMKFDPAEERVIAYDKTQGIQGNEFKYNSQTIRKNGDMVFGGGNGITIFNPDKIKGNPVVPKVVFTDFKIYNKSVEIDGEEELLTQHINNTGYIKLKHKHKVFSFEFASLDYTSPSKNQYKYRLKGYDDDWINSGNINFASYTNVRAGHYVFQLMGSNSDGEWNPEIREIRIRMQPPFYQTKLFMGSVLLFVVFLIIRTIKQRERKIKQDKMLLKEKIDEGKRELKKHLKEIEEQKEEMLLRDEQEKELRFFNKGMAQFSDVIAKSRSDIKELSGNVISNLVTYIGANAGAIYIAENIGEDKVVLRREVTFCYGANEDETVIEPGEGYVGTCYATRKNISIDNMPEGKVVLCSGLGQISIRNIVFIPVMHDEECLGVLEMASLNSLMVYKISFVEKIGETLGSVFAVEKANEAVKEMLENNRSQAKELQAQEVELRNNLEEMKATQEDLNRQIESVDSLKDELRTARQKISELESAKKRK